MRRLASHILYTAVAALCVTAASWATVKTVTQPPYIVDNCATERNVSWPNGSYVYCKDNDTLAILDNGSFVSVNGGGTGTALLNNYTETLMMADVKSRGPAVDVRSYASINAAVTAIGSDNATLLIPSTQTLAASLTIPANVSVVFLGGGRIDKASAYTLTVNGHLSAPLKQIFLGFSAGNVTFGAANPIAYVEWFGATGNGTTDDTDSINQAMNAVSGSHGIVQLSDRTYGVSTSSSITFPSGQRVWLRGTGRRGATLKALGAYPVLVLPSSAENYVEISHVNLNGNSQGGTVIKMNGNAYTHIHDCLIINAGIGIDDGVSGAHYATIERVRFSSDNVGILFDNTSNATRVQSCDFVGTSAYSILASSTFAGDHVQISDCAFGTSGTTDYIKLQASSGYQGIMATVRGCRFDGATSNAHINVGQYVGANLLGNIHTGAQTNQVKVDGANVGIHDCYFAQSTGAAIALSSNADNCVIGTQKWGVASVAPASKVSNAGTLRNFMVGTVDNVTTAAPIMRGQMAIRADNTSWVATCTTDNSCWKEQTNTSVSYTPADNSIAVSKLLASVTEGYIPKVSSGVVVWAPDAQSAGSNPGFDNVLSGTNTSATMTVGTGGTLTYSGSGIVNASRLYNNTAVDNTEFGYLDGVSSAIQTQINAKQATITDNSVALSRLYTTGGTAGATTFLRGDNTWSAVGSTTTSLPFDNITTGTSTTTLTMGNSGTLGYTGTGIIDARRYQGNTTVDATEFGYLDNVTSGIQTQLNAKQATITDNSIYGVKLYSTGGTPSASTWYRGDNTWAAPPAGFDHVTSGTSTNAEMTVGTASFITYADTGYVNANRFAGVTTVSGTEFGMLDNVTAGIQTQLNAKQATITDNSIYGSRLYYASGAPSSTTFYRGDNTWATPATGTVTEGNFSFSDNTTANATTSAHGLLLKATAPASGLYNYVGITNGETAYTNKALFDATVPSTEAVPNVAATGSATVAARRDHSHAITLPALDSLAAPSDNTTLNASTSAHGLAPKGTVGTTQFWRQDWTLATPSATVSDNSVGGVKLYTVSGLPTSATYYRGDNTWATPTATATQVSLDSGVAGDHVAKAKLTADTKYRTFLGIDASSRGVLSFGAGSSTDNDVAIYRSAAGEVTFDNVAGGSSSFKATAFRTTGLDNTHFLNVNNSADPSTPSHGDIWYDNTASRIEVRGASTTSYILDNNASMVVAEAPLTDSTFQGIAVTMVAGENLVAGDVVYFKGSDGKCWKADANVAGASPAMGLAMSTIAANATGQILLHGIARLDSWSWTPGSVLYLSTTAGALTATQPTATDDVIQILGIATHADRVYWYPQLTWISHT